MPSPRFPSLSEKDARERFAKAGVVLVQYSGERQKPSLVICPRCNVQAEISLYEIEQRKQGMYCGECRKELDQQERERKHFACEKVGLELFQKALELLVREKNRLAALNDKGELSDKRRLQTTERLIADYEKFIAGYQAYLAERRAADVEDLWDLLESLNTPEQRRTWGEFMAKHKLAAENARKDLCEPTTYEDGSIDCPFLIPEEIERYEKAEDEDERAKLE